MNADFWKIAAATTKPSFTQLFIHAELYQIIKAKKADEF